ncbi:uncharacterized protein LOC107472371 [Arachis duranensis]|uniref:Uncharacterized protein LOC107472371 n=1 Tax=Arachis duranensis TaxID=130453 RepID=A0A6P4BWI5_ARADU|nr:uncharacterized protein LOC107472371 [Arachis duranensis]
MSGASRLNPEDERILRRIRRAERGKGIFGEEESEGEDQVMEDNLHIPPGGVCNNDGPPRRVLSSYTIPDPKHCGSSIATPTVQANNFELKPQLITLVQNNCSYGGGPLEDPNQHLFVFLRICNTVKTNRVHPDVYKLLLFPFSLRDKATQWLESFPKESLNDWNEVMSRFLAKFYPPQKIIKLKTEVQTFRQMDGESLYEAWERYKALMRRCPPNMFSDWVKLQNFYEGLNPEARKGLDYSSGGSLNMMKTAEEAQDLIEIVANNQYYYSSERQHNPAPKKGVMELEGIDAILAQNKLIHQQIQQQMEMITKRMDGLQLASANTTNQSSLEWGQGEGTTIEQPQEQVQYMQNTSNSQDEFHGDTYNPSWKNHPNLK